MLTVKLVARLRRFLGRVLPWHLIGATAELLYLLDRHLLKDVAIARDEIEYLVCDFSSERRRSSLAAPSARSWNTGPAVIEIRGVEVVTEHDAMTFAAEWIDAWNQRDLERILSHYSTDIVFLSPIAEQLTGHGCVIGIDMLRGYWQRGLDAIPNLKFQLLKVLTGHQCLTILYKNQKNQTVAETVERGFDGKIVRAFACYSH